MDTTLARQIAQKVHTLDPEGPETALRGLALSGWSELLQNLTFHPSSTGGGCMMLLAELPGTGGYQMGVTDGEAGLPTQADRGWLCLLAPDGEELYAASLEAGQLHVQR